MPIQHIHRNVFIMWVKMKLEGKEKTSYFSELRIDLSTSCLVNAQLWPPLNVTAGNFNHCHYYHWITQEISIRRNVSRAHTKDG